MLCAGVCKNGKVCKYKAKINGYCNIHNKTNIICECTVCLEPIVNNHIKLNCDHIFHKNCISPWFNNNNNTCPTCRTIVSKSIMISLGIDLDIITDAINDFENYTYHQIINIPIEIRYITAFIAIIDTLKQETLLRNNVIFYLQKRCVTPSDQIDKLRAEITLIAAWKREVLNLGFVNSITINRAQLLNKMTIRIKQLYSWDNII